MTRTSATYHHSPIGFPKAILKLHEEQGKIVSAYWTLHGIMQDEWHFSTAYRPGYAGDIEKELEQFDAVIRSKFSDDATVQG